MAMIRFLLIVLSVSCLLIEKATAQNGVFDVRLKLNKADCNNQKLLVDVEIKAQSESTAFLMGNANFRFLYDTQFLQHPALVEQYNFSSAGKAADRNYNPQSLNGSSERLNQGIVSLNIIYSGSGQEAVTVGRTWLPVATLQFDLVNVHASTKTAITWNDDKTFPVTGLSEVVPKGNTTDMDAYVVKASGLFQNLDINSLATICSGINTADAGELMIPEGFSPNGDGFNDRFVLYHLGAFKAEVTVYNLSGSLVYHSTDYQNDWDGQTERGVVPSGTYFYSIKLSDGRSFERSMTISY